MLFRKVSDLQNTVVVFLLTWDDGAKVTFKSTWISRKMPWTVGVQAFTKQSLLFPFTLSLTLSHSLPFTLWAFVCCISQKRLEQKFATFRKISWVKIKMKNMLAVKGWRNGYEMTLDYVSTNSQVLCLKI